MTLQGLYQRLACTRKITVNSQPVDNCVQNTTSRSRHAYVIHMLDSAGTLSARAHQGLRASRFKRVARSVAFVIGISLSIGCTPVDAGVTHAFTSKDYIRSLLPKDEALCLIKLYGKESAFNRLAIGNLNGAIHTYGIPQLKNPLIAHMSAYNQIDYGIKYIEHRYKDSCDAYAHWLKKGWH